MVTSGLQHPAECVGKIKLHMRPLVKRSVVGFKPGDGGVGGGGSGGGGGGPPPKTLSH